MTTPVKCEFPDCNSDGERVYLCSTHYPLDLQRNKPKLLAERLVKKDQEIKQNKISEKEELTDKWYKKLTKWLERCTPEEPGKAVYHECGFVHDVNFRLLCDLFAEEGVEMSYWPGNMRYESCLTFKWKAN